uniref:Uncharacterized protein n=1 Tax=Anguilla anguilla TaxID=7936 RepID=A0A0E9S202_ANGAN
MHAGIHFGTLGYRSTATGLFLLTSFNS